MIKRINILISVLLVFILFINISCLSSSLLAGLFQIAKTTGLIDKLQDGIVNVGRRLFNRDNEEGKQESRAGLEEEVVKVEHKYPRFSTIKEVNPDFIWADVKNAEYEIFLYEKAGTEYKLLQNKIVDGGSLLEDRILISDETTNKLVEEVKSRYKIVFPFDNDLERGKEYAWEAVITNPEEVTVTYEEVDLFIDEDDKVLLEDAPRRIEDMIPFKVATDEELALIDEEYLQFKTAVEESYDERQFEEQDEIGLFDFYLALLSYENNLLHEAEGHIINALLKIESYMLPEDMAEVVENEQNILTNEYQYVLVAQVIYTDLSLPYEYKQLLAKREYLENNIDVFPYNINEYVSGVRK